MKIILASASPRRRELLRQIGIEPQIMVVPFQETTGGKSPESLVAYNAYGKGAVVAAKEPQAVVIAADTVVTLDDMILGKPASAQEAVAMLQRLSGKTHKVLTGVAIFYQGREFTLVETTQVEFYHLSEQQIGAYVATGEPMDKAGAYGIQGRGAVLVKNIIGSYSNVVGLPLGALYQSLLELGVAPEK